MTPRHGNAWTNRIASALPVRLWCVVFLALGLGVLPLLTAQTAVADDRAFTTESADLREEPTNTAPVVQTIPADQEVTITGSVRNNHVPVLYRDQEGWMLESTLAFEPIAAASPEPRPASEKPSGEAITVETLNMRADPDPDAEALTLVPAGSTVETYDELSGRYRKIRFDEHDGWVRSIYLDGAPPVTGGHDLGHAARLSSAPGAGAAPSGKATVTAEMILRSAPEASAEKVGVIPIDSPVTLTGAYEDGFAEVEFDGTRGWVAAVYLNRAVDPAAGGPREIPVLMYHSIQQTPGEYQITAWQVEEQLAWLAANGYTTITSSELLAWMAYGAPLPDKPIMITIDDGNASDWLFLELLERHEMKGVFFLPSYAQLSPAQIRTLHRGGEVCGHSVSHRFLATLTYEEQYYEVAENKRFLDEVLSEEATCFAYPFGSYNGLTTSVVIESGYLIAYDFNSRYDLMPLDGSLNRWHIDRINVSGHYTLADFIAVIDAND
jgi:peptidoglycan/xylan/chitin deacetylase (PgdA/CDA1 family)/uncharacterized protein YraI